MSELAGYEQTNDQQGSELYPFEESSNQQKKTRSKVKTKVGYDVASMVTWKKVEYTILIYSQGKNT